MTSKITNPSHQAHANRSSFLRKRQEQMSEELNRQQEALENAANMRTGINNKFSSATEKPSSTPTSSTTKKYGLVTLEQMQQQTKEDEEQRRKDIIAMEKAKKAAKKRKSAQRKAALSFDMEDEEGLDKSEELSPKKSKGKQPEKKEKSSRIGKNPEVDTSYLPDKEREAYLRKRKEELLKQWLIEQEELKKEKAIIGFSYWDGSDHMRKVKVMKGDTVATFIKKALKTVRRDHQELRSINVEEMLFIRDNVIMPQHLTFYDLILHQANNRGQLFFDFDGPKLKKDDPRSSKMCMRSWYESNKHIFPASCWESFDQAKHQAPM
eukprot:m.10340 g.10340  ORF g.10340 m.10340 type:complete len:323 (-) comp3656_c0_seq1:42-1010(-)